MALIVLWIAALPALAQTVTDGDTIKQNGVTYRLWGIDAPESKQTCRDGWPAGKEATNYMSMLLAGREVICEPRGRDMYGRTLGPCRAGGQDVQAEMVSAWHGMGVR